MSIPLHIFTMNLILNKNKFDFFTIIKLSKEYIHSVLWAQFTFTFQEKYKDENSTLKGQAPPKSPLEIFAPPIVWGCL